MLSAAFCIALLSCSDDDKKDSKSNEFTAGSMTIPILEGLYYVDQQDIGYSWHLELQGETEKKGGQVEFTVFHGDGSSLTAGTYTFDAEALKNMDPFTFHTVYADTYNAETQESIQYEQNVKSGTIKIEKSGDTYTFTIDVVLEGDISIKGYYKGSIKAGI
jgi:hypothetical protein